jgi:hypothetical protein
MKYCSKQGEKIMILIVIILMSKFGFKDKEVLIKLTVVIVTPVNVFRFHPRKI